ncbi:MAG: D-aminoacylase [Bryobacteraceae bacterium]|nr:D-aminoacylase [Bryobacteraceae bacterium]
MKAGALFLIAALAADAATLIRGAMLADGSGAKLRQADVRIGKGRILRIGRLAPQPGDSLVDGAGLVLAPGFIDLHNHSDRGLDREPEAASQVSQGITTAIVGQDGGSPWPIASWFQPRNAAIHTAILAGHATIRRAVMGDGFRRAARPNEIERMAALLEQAMRDGALGLSTGLEYEIGGYSTTEEVIALARVAARHKGIYVSHIRDEADKTFEALREVIRIAEEARIPAHVSHIKLGTVGVWGKAKEAIALIEAARKRGLDITADCYPYDAWSSTITVLIPSKKYDDPESVARGLADVGGAGNVTITTCARHPEYEFQTLEQIARSQNRSPVDLFIEIVREGGAGVVCRSMKDEDIREFYRAPWVMVSSDGGIGMRHPRGAGSYPRVLGLFVRERKWLTLEEAIRKMTSAPAARLGWRDRGLVREGFVADLVLFDPATVIDRSTFADPFREAVGVRKVWVNGELVWDSRSTAATPGEKLRRLPVHAVR